MRCSAKRNLHGTAWLLAAGALFGLLTAGALTTPAQEKKKDDKKEEKKDEPKQEEKKEIPKDKTPPVLVLKGHTDWVNSVAYSPDGKYLVTASRDRTLKVWEAATGKELKTLEKHPRDVRKAVFSPDNKYVVSVTGDWNKKDNKWEGEVKFFDVESGKEVRSLTGHTDTIEALAFSPDGKYLVTAGDDLTAIIWEVKTGKQLQTLKGHKEKILSVAFSKDGNKVATGSAAPPQIAAQPDAKDAKGKKGKKDDKDKKDDKGKKAESDDPCVKVWDVQSGKELHTLQGPERDVTSVAFSPEGDVIAAGSLDGAVQLWDASGKELRKLEAPEGIWSISFTPDGKYLAAGGWNDTIKVYEVADGKELFYRNGHERTVTTVTFSPDSHRLVTAGIDATVKVWEMPK